MNWKKWILVLMIFMIGNGGLLLYGAKDPVPLFPSYLVMIFIYFPIGVIIGTCGEQVETKVVPINFFVVIFLLGIQIIPPVFYVGMNLWALLLKIHAQIGFSLVAGYCLSNGVRGIMKKVNEK